MEHLEKEHRSDDDTEYEDEEVDPRIQGELEKLNQSTDDINRCETELEDARQKFRSVLVEATVKLDEVMKKIGKAVEESKPYWEARRLARQAQLEAQKATQDFQRATEVLRAAKETISLAEQRLLEEDNRQFDSAWQEMLNHATQRVMEAEHTKTRSELVHKETAAKYTAAISRMKQLEKKLKRTINKSKPYFEMKAKYYLQLENLKKNVDERQAKLSQAKGEYKTALRNLEMISDEIHERRRSSAIGPRVRGVGAEGDSVSGDDVSSFKMESDGISMASVCFDDEACGGGDGGGGGSVMSEEDSETRSTCSLGSSPRSPQEVLSPCAFASSASSSSSCTFSSASPSPTPSSSSSSPSPLSRPCSLDLPSTVSLSDFGLISPVLGPRSECSGASSPECDLERGDRAEGAEGDLDNAPPTTTTIINNNSSSSSSSTSSTKKTFSLETRFSFLNLRRPRANNARNTDSCSQKAESGQTVVLVK
uniref:SH3 domain-binding protein 5-like n=1 Tax=Scatophagus argus TaxID=75038 RepID=UPI001ED8121B|nr:SH3 domain-binding protein 5-like [Scatophagus argus]XP_046254516.1 SH3 domain-binding protein 5-like [Scatophagus argus]XP_046254517.1 SH3 domain-binding protein 5-like [Scatophagus argus]XP_046254518.1 SH3 domain-binding protein 5-like [Scatophagus argus]